MEGLDVDKDQLAKAIRRQMIYGGVLTDREQYMMLLSEEKRQKLQNHFGITEEQALELLSTDEEKQQQFKRTKQDK